MFRTWLTAEFRDLGGGDANVRGLRVPGQTQEVAVIAHVYQDGDGLRREVAVLEAWIKSV